MRIRILGCGHSGGTPMVGGEDGEDWGACDPDEPKNRRLRPSILIEEDGKTLLVDTSPDLRAQLLTAGVTRLDGVLFTHAHADHLHGIDDLRAINMNMNAALPAYASAATWQAIRERFAYVLDPLPEGSKFFYKPSIQPHTIEHGQTFSAGGMDVTAFTQDHGYSESFGFRTGRFAYSADLCRLPEESEPFVQNLEVWIVDALRDRPNPVHFMVEEAVALIGRMKPKRAYLTHLSHGLDYAKLSARLPEGAAPAHDGLIIDLD